MKFCRAVIGKIDQLLEDIAGFALLAMVLLTVADVSLRYFGRPIPGTYELVGFLGAILLGLGLPKTSLIRGHVRVDVLVERLNKKMKTLIEIATVLATAAVVVGIGWSLISLGSMLRDVGEVSPTIELPFYPVAWGLGIAFGFLCLTLLCSVVRKSEEPGGTSNE